MKKILIIEDNADVRENLAEILSLSGYEACTAENGKKGIEKVKECNPDLIICDIMMPELDGYGVLHILSRQADTADIPFIFLTAKAEKDDFRKGMALGADDYITKPFDDILLLQTIEARLKKSERLRTAIQVQPDRVGKFINEAKAVQSLHDLSEHHELRHYRKKDPIYRESDYPRWFFCVESGKVKVYKNTEDGRELIVSVVGPGEFFGIQALFENQPYTESANALEDASIRLIPHKDFISLLYTDRDVNAHFIKMLAGHVAVREQQLLDMAYYSVRKRVAITLVHLHDQNPNEPLQMLREDLAAITGTAKETLIRTLTDFKNEGMIEIKDGIIVIHKIEKLRNLPN